jgi:nucleoside-diphosphate-sugar epimerase
MDTTNSNVTVLVTGATGFVAGHCIDQLLKKGYSVRGTVRDPSKTKKIQHLEAWKKQGFHVDIVKADLLNSTDQEWDDAVKGCTFVLHTASPFPAETPKDENVLIKPAVEGTLSVLKACARSKGQVKRVVLTSSVAAIGDVAGSGTGKVLDESDWLDLNKAEPYPKSKALAEKAAWDFVKDLKEDEKFELATVNPSFIIGPSIASSDSGSFTSADIIAKFLNRDLPAIPALSMGVVDVRDVAKEHILVMESPNAAGERWIASSACIWFHDMAVELDKEFSPRGYKIPTTKLPHAVAWIASFFDKQLAMVLPNLGKEMKVTAQKAQDKLGMQFLPWQKSLTDMAHSLIQQGFVKMKPQYRPKLNVLITGARGYIGAAVAKRYSIAGHTVYVLCRDEAAVKDAEGAGYVPVQGNVNDLSSMNLSHINLVIHCAFVPGPQSLELDKQAVSVLSDFCSNSSQKFKGAIYTSGCLCIGDSEAEKTITEDNYAEASKVSEVIQWRIENEKQLLSNSNGRAVSVRPGFVYGGVGSHGSNFYKGFQENDKKVPIPKNAGRFPWVHLEDLAEQYLLVGEALLVKPNVSGIYHFVDGRPSVTHESVITAFGKALGGTGETVEVEIPGPFGQLLQLQQGHVVADKVKKQLGWKGPVHGAVTDPKEIEKWVNDLKA